VTRRRLTALVTCVVLLALPGEAQAHEPVPPGGGGSIATDEARNMHLLAEFPAGDEGSRPVNSDMAFWGNYAYVGNYDGFRIFDISGRVPSLVSDVRCPGPQGDPSVWDRDGDGNADLLILSVDRTMTGPECSATPTTDHADRDGWEGLRIFDVTDPAEPTFIAGVYQDCGSHTNSLLPSGDRLFVLNSSYPLRAGPTCGPHATEDGRDPLHGVVQVVEIDLADPAASREVAELPLVYPGDPDNKFTPSEHGLSARGVLLDGMRACHDLAVFTEIGLVGAACAEQAQLWRIDPATGLPDTAKPVWVYDQPNVDFWHSATFSWDGKVVNFIDESFGSGCPTTTVKTAGLPGDPREYETGNMFFLDTSTGSLLSEFRIERSGGGDAASYCSSHLGNVVPARNRYLLVNAYYTGGVSVIDFTDPTDPAEIAFYDKGSDTWAAYWYEYRPGSARRMSVWANDGIHTPATGGGFQSFEALVPPTSRVPLSSLNPQLQERTIETHVRQDWRHRRGNPTTFADGHPGGGRSTRPSADRVAHLAGD
jgi:hypothetical protein